MSERQGLKGFHRTDTTPDGLVFLVTTLRCATTAIGLLWALTLSPGESDLRAGGVLIAYTGYRIFRQIDYGKPGWKSLLSILTELVVCLGVVALTETWNSPFIFSLFTPVIAAGFARGFWHSFRIAVTAALTIAIASWLLDDGAHSETVISWSGELLLTAIVAGYARRLITRASQANALNLEQLWRLNEANQLLVGLNRLSHDLPVAFDFTETVQEAMSLVRTKLRPDTSAVLLQDPTSAQWSVVSAEGVRLPDNLDQGRLPAGLYPAITGTNTTVVALDEAVPGLKASSRQGVYVPLIAGERRVGLLAIESDNENNFAPEATTEVSEMAGTIALTIDNARWFERLRARGALQERARLARDLHDRVGQGMAYIAFELDRLAEIAKGGELESPITNLGADARSIVRELRETLYDLRTDVSAEIDIAETLDAFLKRVASRSGIQTHFLHDVARRLPLNQEREIWRIAQEAVVNAERHAGANCIEVNWHVDAGGALLSISDDGVGLETSSMEGLGELSTSRPSYGLTGMRERAAALGAQLDIDSASESGTTVTLRLGRPQPVAASSVRNTSDETNAK